MTEYKWNKLQKTAFVCWGLGGLLIVLPILILMFSIQTIMENEKLILGVMGSLLAGIVVLALGGTLHKVGTGRDQK
jgi:hypothetical protein